MPFRAATVAAGLAFVPDVAERMRARSPTHTDLFDMTGMFRAFKAKADIDPDDLALIAVTVNVELARGG